MQGVVMYSDQMHDFAIHRHGDVERAIAVEAIFLLYMIPNISAHHPTACVRTIEEPLQVTTLIEQDNGLHVKQ